MGPDRDAARKRFLERAKAAGAPATNILAGAPVASSEAAALTARRILGGLRPADERLAKLATALDNLAAADGAQNARSRQTSRRRTGA